MADPAQALSRLPAMTKLTMDNITDNVVLMNSLNPDPRLKFILERVVVHLHDFIRETRLTHAELMASLKFLTEESILLTDILGLSMLIDSIESPKLPGATQGTVLGPFHTHDVEDKAVGSQLTSDTNGEPVLALCTVKDLHGKPVAGVKADIWEADSTGHYDMQYPDRDGPDGRCVMHTDENGFFWFKAIVPVPYPIPAGGAAGQLMKKLGRHCWRPAHIHFMLEKPAYDRLITSLYFRNDPYTTTDPVFGVKEGLIVDLEKADKQTADKYGVKEGTAVMVYTFVLVPEQDAVDLRAKQTKHAFDKLGKKVKMRQYTDRSHATTSPIRHVVLRNRNYNNSNEPTLLVLVMTEDVGSWAQGRNVSSFLDMLLWTELDAATITLALLTSSEEEFDTYLASQAAVLATDYASLHLIHHPGYAADRKGKGMGMGMYRMFRHLGGVQHARRVEMARLRNYASLAALEPSHQHLLWIDADVYEVSPGLVQRMLAFSAADPRVGIQTAISHWGDGDGDYDFNAWVGPRTSPDERQRARLRTDKGSWQADSVAGKNSESAESSEIDGLVRLDAVGATVLLMKAHLWRQGLSFATSYLVGTDWQDEGWDAVESEGLCVTARNLINEESGRQGGVGCWGIVDGYTRHSDT
ncbi:hypothetical protein DV735_g3185, partial [Chaetothyriales sp. CBS 134920]